MLTLAGLLTVLVPSAPGARPNVLFIAVDDLVPALGCYGDPLAVTPNIDTLASAGTLFLNSYTPWPVCGPARAALTTSLTPEETGVMGFKPIRAALPDVITLPQHFRNNGYETACTGKFHDPRTVGVITDPDGPTSGGANTDDVPSWSIPYVKADPGFNPPNNPAVDATDQPDSLYGDHAILQEGLTLLNTVATGTRPFFLAVGFKKPHLPFVAPRQYWDLYDRNSFEVAPFTQPPAGASLYTTNMVGDNDELLGYEPYITNGLPDIDQQRELIHGYYACASFIDALVGQLRVALAATDDPLNPGQKLSATTLILLWGDHGFHLGDHGKWAKHTNLERAAFCPLIIFDPRHPTGIKTTAPVNAMDIYPTLCELAGLPIPEQPLSAGQPTGRPLRGRSLVPLLADPEASVHAGAFTLYRLNGGYGYAYRTQRFRYIEWVDSSDTVTARELYDYAVDPLETTNRISDPRYATVVYQLSRSMRAETTSRGAPRLQNSAPIPASGAGIELGDGLLPDLAIASQGASAVNLQWPWSNGVTYDVTQKTQLRQPAWNTGASSVVGGSRAFPVEGPERYYRVQLGSNLPPVFEADPIVMPSAVTNTAYVESLAAKASDANIGDTLAFAKLDGPSWLGVDANGDLSGTPSASDLGAGYFTVRVADNHGATAEARLQITVTEPPPPPPASLTNVFPATDDTFAKQANPTLDAGNRATLELRQEAGSSFARVGYLNFTVTGVSNVIGARLFLHSKSEADVVNALAVAEVSWTENSLNWSNRPPTGALMGSASATPGAWFTIDVSSHVTTNGTYAIALDEQGNTFQEIDSTEGGYPPRLEIESALD